MNFVINLVYPTAIVIHIHCNCSDSNNHCIAVPLQPPSLNKTPDGRPLHPPAANPATTTVAALAHAVAAPSVVQYWGG